VSASRQLPEGWAWATLDEFTQGRGQSLDPSRHKAETFELYSIPGFDAGAPELLNGSAIGSAKQMVNAGDVLLSKINPRINRVWLVGEDRGFRQIASTEWIVFPRNDYINGDYLKFFLRQHHVRNFLASNVSGVGGSLMRIKASTLDGYPIPVAPRDEQRRIVEKIEALFAELDKGEESLRQVQKLLARYRQSVLKAAVTGELTADWRARHAGKLEHGRDFLARILKARRENWQGRGEYKDPVRPHADRLPELPQGWVWTTVDQLLVHLTSGSRDWKRFYGRGNGVFIMAQNVRPMRFDLSERFLVDPPRGSPDAVRSEVKKDDLLVTIVGANTGDVCRFPLDAREHYVCQSVALIRLADARFSRYLELYLSSHGGGREQIDAFIYGAGRPHLSFEQLRSICVPLPPFEEQAEIQRRVAEVVDQIDKIQQACTLEFARSSALRNSILKFAFSGRLVPQDPNDEPASELLARIRAQRASESRKTTRRAATA